MAESTGNQAAQTAAELAAAARERGKDQLEGAKGQLAEGAERIAAAVERTTEELDGEGDSGLSGFGHSVASLMRQLAGGLRERDVEEFARELGALARRNPGVFLAGSVAVGFGIARFFKARAPAEHGGDHWRDGVGGWQEFGEAELERADFDARTDFDADETLDLSAGAMRRGDDASDRNSAASGAAAENLGTTSHDDERSADDRNAGKSRQSGKQSKAKAQRAAGGGSQAGEQGRDEAAERTPPAGGPTTGTRTTGTSDSTTTSGGTAPSRGGKQ